MTLAEEKIKARKEMIRDLEIRMAADRLDPRDKHALQMIRELQATVLANKLRKEQEMKRRGEKKIGRNEPCPCGSGMKYKRCCI
jgi:uncharacterized protein YecA (UPF0149 family)